jgi:hypothetical protein
MTGAPDMPGRDAVLDQHVIRRKPSKLRFGCDAAPLPDRICRRLDLEWIAQDEDLHPDFYPKRRIGQDVQRVEGDNQFLRFERDGQDGNIDALAERYAGRMVSSAPDAGLQHVMVTYSNRVSA